MGRWAGYSSVNFRCSSGRGRSGGAGDVERQAPQVLRRCERDAAAEQIPDADSPQCWGFTGQGSLPPAPQRALGGRRLATALIEGDYVRNGHLTDEAGDVSTQLAELGEEYRAIMLPEDILPAMDRLNQGDRIELTVVMPVKTASEATQMAIQVTYGTVVDVLMQDDEPIGLLLAVKKDDVPRTALALESGTVTAAFVPTGVSAATSSASPAASR